MEHFNPLVTKVMQDKLKALATHVKDYEIDSFQNTESYGDAAISEIYGVHIPGFIPFQLGGFEVSTLIRHDTDTSYHIGGMTQSANDSFDYCFECWLADKELPKDTQRDSLTDAQWDDFGEYENDWFEPALLRFECWVSQKEDFKTDEKEVDKVFMRLSVNYADAPYYRSKRDETLYELEMSLKVFMAEVSTPEGLWNVMITYGAK